MNPSPLSSANDLRPKDRVAESSVHQLYRKRLDRLNDEVVQLETQSRKASSLRLVLFGMAMLCLGVTLISPAVPRSPMYAIAFAFLSVFFVVVRRHGRVIDALNKARGGVEMQQRALARIDRDWNALPIPELGTHEPPIFARDLDLLGRASLTHLLGGVATPGGRARLCSWLYEPAVPETVRWRQEAGYELLGRRPSRILDPAALDSESASRLDFRQRFEWLAQPLARRPAGVEPFVEWAEEPSPFSESSALKVAAKLLAVATVAVPIASLFLGWPAGLSFVLPIINFSLAFFLGEKIVAAYRGLETSNEALAPYAQLFELLEELDLPPSGPGQNGESSLRNLLSSQRSVRHELLALRRTVELSSVRYQEAAHFLAQSLLLWDLQIIARLDRWKARSGRELRSWLDGLAEIECLIVLAQLRFDHPGWSEPEIVTATDSDGDRFAARELGHPLLADAVRVTNDVELGPPGSLLLVTGSNMSGKSTLLRSIGLNTVLAQAGAPVCAAELTLPPIEIGTSILIEDSLDQGVSFFLAELKRLKHIVDRARNTPAREQRVLLYLLDEILRGTNASERLEAVRRVLGHLLETRSIGAISTHDLRLAEADEVASRCTAVHLRETLNTDPALPPMTFDYRVRPGVAPTRNALKLLELVGLGESAAPHDRHHSEDADSV